MLQMLKLNTWVAPTWLQGYALVHIKRHLLFQFSKENCSSLAIAYCKYPFYNFLTYSLHSKHVYLKKNLLRQIYSYLKTCMCGKVCFKQWKASASKEFCIKNRKPYWSDNTPAEYLSKRMIDDNLKWS